MSTHTSGVLSCAIESSYRVTASTFSLVFAVFVLAALAWRTWLGLRQARHVALHRESVPADFVPFIPLEAHRKAADYTLEKQRLALVETAAIDGLVLLALTLGGGLAAIDALSARLLGFASGGGRVSWLSWVHGS